MKGYRTLVVSAVQLVVGLLAAFGYVLPEGTEQALAENINVAIGAVLVITGIVQAVMRLMTDTPPMEK